MRRLVLLAFVAMLTVPAGATAAGPDGSMTVTVVDLATGGVSTVAHRDDADGRIDAVVVGPDAVTVLDTGARRTRVDVLPLTGGTPLARLPWPRLGREGELSAAPAGDRVVAHDSSYAYRVAALDGSGAVPLGYDISWAWAADGRLAVLGRETQQLHVVVPGGSLDAGVPTSAHALLSWGTAPLPTAATRVDGRLATGPIDLATGVVAPATPVTRSLETDSVLSPDGARAARWAVRADGRAALEVVDVATGAVRRVAGFAAGIGTTPQWSADGTRLAFTHVVPPRRLPPMPRRCDPGNDDDEVLGPSPWVPFVSDVTAENLPCPRARRVIARYVLRGPDALPGWRCVDEGDDEAASPTCRRGRQTVDFLVWNWPWRGDLR